MFVLQRLEKGTHKNRAPNFQRQSHLGQNVQLPVEHEFPEQPYSRNDLSSSMLTKRKEIVFVPSHQPIRASSFA